MRSLAGALVLVPCISLLAGCGFHLRSAPELPEELSRLELSGTEPYSAIGREVRRTLELSGGALAERGTGDIVLEIGPEHFDRRVASVDAAGKASEYELRYVLTGRLLTPDGAPRTAEQSASVVRTYSVDPANVLGSAGEEEQIRTEMRASAVRQLLRQVRVALRSAPPPS